MMLLISKREEAEEDKCEMIFANQVMQTMSFMLFCFIYYYLLLLLLRNRKVKKEECYYVVSKNNQWN